jgi:mRNA interferase MazF
VAANLEGDDLILCQITSVAREDRYVIRLMNKDFRKGSLKVNSMIRPNRLFTADKSIILYKVGTLRETKLKEVEDKIVKMFRE